MSKKKLSTIGEDFYVAQREDGYYVIYCFDKKTKEEFKTLYEAVRRMADEFQFFLDKLLNKFPM